MDAWGSITDSQKKVQELAVVSYYREELSRRGIPTELADAAGLTVNVANNLNKILSETTPKDKKHVFLHPSEYGIVIPTLDFDGNAIPKIYTIRRSGDALPKYVRPGGSVGVYAYLPPGIDWNMVARDTSIRVVITEGELKALISTQYLDEKTVVVAIPGVTMFDVATNVTQVPRLLDKFTWVNREVAVAFDYENREHKPVAAQNVQRAQDKIIDILFNLYAKPFVINLEEHADGADKLGIDDYFNAGGQLDALKWESQSVSGSAVRELRANYVVCEHPLGAIDVRSGLFWKPSDWKTYHKNKFSIIPKVNRPNESVKQEAADVVWNDPYRRQVSGFIFHPGLPALSVVDYHGKQHFNTWEGFPDLGTESNPEGAVVFERVIRRQHGDHADFKLNWLAHRVQKPGERNNHALVQIDDGSTGKSLMFTVMRGIMGKYCSSVRVTDLVGHFNDSLEHCVLGFVEEVKASDMSGRQMADHIKHITTADALNIEAKGMPVRKDVPFFGCFGFNSNVAVPVLIDTNNRRIVVVKNDSSLKQDAEHQKDLKWLYDRCSVAKATYDPKVCLGIKEWLMERDISMYEATGNVAMTEDAMDLARASLTTAQVLVDEYLDVGEDKKSWFCFSAQIIQFCEQRGEKVTVTQIRSYFEERVKARGWHYQGAKDRIQVRVPGGSITSGFYVSVVAEPWAEVTNKQDLYLRGCEIFTSGSSKTL